MIIGFTGTRKGMTDVQKTVFEAYILPMTEFHHGSCQGADVEAARIVRKTFRLPVPKIVVHPGPAGPWREESGIDNIFLSPKPFLTRNRDIVNACDELIACPKGMEEEKTGGTWYTIRYARKVGKKVTIIYPDGSFG